MTEPTPEWVEKVQAEAMQYVAAVQANFQHGLSLALQLAPDPKDKAQRAEVLDTFLDATFGLAVQFVAELFHAGPKAEEQAVKMIRDKFAYIRQRQAEDPRPKTLGPGAPKVVT